MDETKEESNKAILARLKARRDAIHASVPKKVRKHAPLGMWLRKEKGKKV